MRDARLGGDPRGGRPAETALTVTSLEAMAARPSRADPAITAQFLAGGVLGVIGAWLAEESSPPAPEQLVEALIQCLPGWLLTD